MICMLSRGPSHIAVLFYIAPISMGYVIYYWLQFAAYDSDNATALSMMMM